MQVKRSLSEMIAEKKAKALEAQMQVVEVPIVEEVTEMETLSSGKGLLNKEQLMARQLAENGKSFCLIGAAGTGKTFTQREIAKGLLTKGGLGTHQFRIQGEEAPVTSHGVAFVAFTKTAVANLSRAICSDPDLEGELKYNITTIHNLLEYAPETYYDYQDNKEKFRFAPRRHANRKLDIRVLVIEESSMVGLDLWTNLLAALHKGTIVVFLGDINQLQPVFGASILNYAQAQLPVVELTQVYRQAGDSGVLHNAHNILAGRSFEELEDCRIVRGGDVQHSQTKMSMMLAKTIPAWIEAKAYNPDTDIFLSPWNKHELGTINLNNIIAQHLTTVRGDITFHIQAGISSLYLAVGDAVMVNKKLGKVMKITRNNMYNGKPCKKESLYLNRWGLTTQSSTKEEEVEADINDGYLLDYAGLDIDSTLSSNENILRMASHIVEVLMEDDRLEILSSTGELSPTNFSLAYCLTVHKAQGSQWKKVFFIMHKDHAVSIHRELLYTAITRAEKEVVLIAKDYLIQKAIDTPKIKGNSLQEKLDYFNSGLDLSKQVQVLP